jgi:hypothetical protein
MAIATLILTQCANVFDRVTGRAPQKERLAKSANRVLAAMGS